jgi:hypothetical protein
MQQQVNLYQPAAKDAQGTLSGRTAFRLLILLCVTLASLWGFGSWQLRGLRTGAEAVHAQREAQESLRAAGMSQLESLSQEDLDAHVATLAAALEVKSRALSQLRADADHPRASFAARLEALARQHIEGVWLDHLTLGGTSNVLSLSGTTLSPTLVPQYLHNLASDPALRGAQIDEFVIEQSSSAMLKFRASNEALSPKSVEEQT